MSNTSITVGTNVGGLLPDIMITDERCSADRPTLTRLRKTSSWSKKTMDLAKMDVRLKLPSMNNSAEEPPSPVVEEDPSPLYTRIRSPLPEGCTRPYFRLTRSNSAFISKINPRENI
jgi:hypothetical protein